MTDTNKRGRPRKPKGERRDAMIRFRVRPADFEIISKAAEKVGSIAAWARPILLRAARRELRK